MDKWVYPINQDDPPPRIFTLKNREWWRYESIERASNSLHGNWLKAITSHLMKQVCGHLLHKMAAVTMPKSKQATLSLPTARSVNVAGLMEPFVRHQNNVLPLQKLSQGPITG